MSDNAEIDYLLEEVITLPSMSQTVMHLTEMMNDPEVSLADVGKLISSDPSLALKTLRIVNSAFHGLRETVTSVEHAVTLLGIKVVRNLVLTAAVFDQFQNGEEALLRHSVSCGVAMRALGESGVATNMTIKQPDELFVYGLLHDVGKIIFQEYMPTEYGEVRERCSSGEISSYLAETELIGVDHAALGARLAVKWKLSDALANAIQGHHDFSQCEAAEYRDQAALLCIADYICHSAGLASPDDATPVVPEEAWELTGITSAGILPVLEKVFSSLGDVDELVELAS